MSRPLDERLRQLAAEVEHLHVLPAAAVRARGRRRGRRQLVVTTAAVAVVATTAGVVATRTLEPRPEQTAAPRPAAAQSAGEHSGAGCRLALPDDPASVRLRVIAAGASAARADTIATGLRNRGYTVLPGADRDDHSPAVSFFSPSSSLRYGPAAVGAAALLRAQLRGEITMQFATQIEDDTVEILLGQDAVRLATPTETNQALVAVGEPSAPPMCR